MKFQQRNPKRITSQNTELNEQAHRSHCVRYYTGCCSVHDHHESKYTDSELLQQSTELDPGNTKRNMASQQKLKTQI